MPRYEYACHCRASFLDLNKPGHGASLATI
jgi:hypothetical protein